MLTVRHRDGREMERQIERKGDIEKSLADRKNALSSGARRIITARIHYALISLARRESLVSQDGNCARYIRCIFAFDCY